MSLDEPYMDAYSKSARAVGASREEVCEIIFQMTLYGGFPAMINAMNAALEVFEAEDVA